MTSITEKAIFSLCVCLTLLKSVHCISCYQCSGTDSNNPFECTENLDSDSDMPLTDCSNIHDAQFCIKYVGRYEGHAIDCYQCNSSTTMECGDGLINLDGGLMKATPCDHVYNAQYCIKQIGGISTKRYCSSLDLGNYCNYVSQPGDKLEYRTCIHTCGSDGCNAAASLTWSMGAVGLLVGVILRIFTQ